MHVLEQGLGEKKTIKKVDIEKLKQDMEKMMSAMGLIMQSIDGLSSTGVDKGKLSSSVFGQVNKRTGMHREGSRGSVIQNHHKPGSRGSVIQNTQQNLFNDSPAKPVFRDT